MSIDLEQLKSRVTIVEELSRRGHQPKRTYGKQAQYLCPFPDHDDTEPSFYVRTDNNTFHCYGCDRHGSVIDLVMLLDNVDVKEAIRILGGNVANFAAHRNGRRAKGGEGRSTTSNSPATVQHPPGCTIAQVAETKGLDVDFLKTHGWTDMSYQGVPAVRMPYKDAAGQVTGANFRVALEKSTEGDNRFRYQSGKRRILYGLWRLEWVRSSGRCVLVEGETDTITLWHHDIPALGVPGASNWNDEWAEHLTGIDDIYVIQEPDQGGATLVAKLSTSPLRDRLRIIQAPAEAKDANALHVLDPSAFPRRFEELRAAAELWTDIRARQLAEASTAAWRACGSLAEAEDILSLLAADLGRRGVAGEERVIKLIYLSLVSRLLDRPVNLVMKGPSSGGKSFLVEQVLRYFPPTAFYALSAMSDRALAYMTEPLSHRFLVVYEAAGLAGETATYLIRSLLSEGHIKYVTVEKAQGKLKEKVIEREGPTGLILTTTQVSLHPENETRMLSVPVTDTPEQTRSVLRAIAFEGPAADDGDLHHWHALQVWLDGADHDVTIPYAADLADHIPPVAVRLRRDFRTVLTLIRAHALLHQARRDRNQDGRIVATLEDYAAVRDLVLDLMGDEVQATVSATIRETVNAVTDLSEAEEKPVSLAKLAHALGIDKSAVSRRVRQALHHQYLRNLETKRGQSMQLVPGDPLPEEQELLPRPEALQCCTVDGEDALPLPPVLAEATTV